MGEGPRRLRDVLGEVTKKMGIGGATTTGKIRSAWTEIVGEAVAQHVEPTSLREGTLRLRADSPIWATEVSYLGDEIARRANDVLNRQAVLRTKIWIGPGRDQPTHRPPGSRWQPHPSSDRSGPQGDDPEVALERAKKTWNERSAGP